MSWKPGAVIADPHEVKGLVGRGGMGTVHRVHHQQWKTDLAVKTPSPEVLEKAGGAERFQEREAYQWVRLGLHPNTASCFYVRTLEDGIPRLFIEFVEGCNLKKWILLLDGLDGVAEEHCTACVQVINTGRKSFGLLQGDRTGDDWLSAATNALAA